MTGVYFGVMRNHGVETPCRFFGYVPACYGLAYCTRIDDQPNGDALVNAPLDRLMRLYLVLRRAGKLPEQDRGSKSQQKTPPASRKLGEWWEPPAPSWDQWAPFADNWKISK